MVWRGLGCGGVGVVVWEFQAITCASHLYISTAEGAGAGENEKLVEGKGDIPFGAASTVHGAAGAVRLTWSAMRGMGTPGQRAAIHEEGCAMRALSGFLRSGPDGRAGWVRQAVSPVALAKLASRPV
jgi:hypothetical protein